MRSKELFSLEGSGDERIEDYRQDSAKSSNQQESDEEAAVYKLTTFNLGRYRQGVAPQLNTVTEIPWEGIACLFQPPAHTSSPSPPPG